MSKLYLGSAPLIDMTGYATESYVQGEIAKVDVSDQLTDYIQKEEGKGLSTNDFTDELKNKLDGINPDNYVVKDGDKVLSDNNFTDALKTKLDGLENFDPTDVNAAIAAVQKAVDELIAGGENVTEAIDTFNEIKAFLNTYKNTDNLVNLLSTQESNIKAWVGEQNYLVADDLTDYAKTADIADAYQPKGEYALKSDLPTDYLTDEDVAGLAKTADVEANYVKKTEVGNAKVVKISNADFIALETKDPNTLYIVE